MDVNTCAHTQKSNTCVVHMHGYAASCMWVLQGIGAAYGQSTASRPAVPIQAISEPARQPGNCCPCHTACCRRAAPAHAGGVVRGGSAGLRREPAYAEAVAVEVAVAQVEGQAAVIAPLARVVALLDDGTRGPHHHVRHRDGGAHVGHEAADGPGRKWCGNVRGGRGWEMGSKPTGARTAVTHSRRPSAVL